MERGVNKRKLKNREETMKRKQMEKLENSYLLNWLTQLLTKESILLPEDFLISFNIVIAVARA